MSVWPKSFLDPTSDRWRRKVENDSDASTTGLARLAANVLSLSSAITGLRGRVAAQYGNLQSGVAIVQGDGTTAINVDVTFDVPYDDPPVVVAGAAGYRTSYSVDVSGNSYAGIGDWGNVTVLAVTGTGFSIVMAASAAATYSTANYYYITWMARALG